MLATVMHSSIMYNKIMIVKHNKENQDSCQEVERCCAVVAATDGGSYVDMVTWLILQTSSNKVVIIVKYTHIDSYMNTEIYRERQVYRHGCVDTHTEFTSAATTAFVFRVSELCVCWF